MSPAPDPVLQFGVLLPGAFAAFDTVAPVDLLGMATPAYHHSMGVPGPVPDAARPIDFHYISESASTALATSGFCIAPTCTLDTCPPLDVLFVPGTPLGYVPTSAEVAFLREKAASVDVLMAVCTAPLMLASTGLIDGRRATLNRTLYARARDTYPAVQWQRGVRWAVDSADRGGPELWTSGGAAAGMDMMLAFMRGRLDQDEMADVVCTLLDYVPRGRKDVPQGSGARSQAWAGGRMNA